MNDLPAGIVRFEDVAQAKMSSTRCLFTYWRESWRHGRPLRRTELDPSAMKEALPFVLLGDIEPAPFRVLFRLVGTSVADFSRQDFTGKYLDELVYDARDSVEWRECYRFVHAEKVAILGINQLQFADGRLVSYEFAILPLMRGDDPAGSFISIEAYDDFDRLFIPDLNPVSKRS